MKKVQEGEDKVDKKVDKQKKEEKEPGFWDLVNFAPEMFPGSGITFEKWQQNFEYEVRRRKEKMQEKFEKEMDAKIREMRRPEPSEL